MKPKVSLFEDSFFSTKAEILKYTKLRIEMLRFVKFYKLLYASRNRLSYQLTFATSYIKIASTATKTRPCEIQIFAQFQN